MAFQEITVSSPTDLINKLQGFAVNQAGWHSAAGGVFHRESTDPTQFRITTNHLAPSRSAVCDNFRLSLINDFYAGNLTDGNHDLWVCPVYGYGRVFFKSHDGWILVIILDGRYCHCFCMGYTEGVDGHAFVSGSGYSFEPSSGSPFKRVMGDGFGHLLNGRLQSRDRYQHFGGILRESDLKFFRAGGSPSNGTPVVYDGGIHSDAYYKNTVAGINIIGDTHLFFPSHIMLNIKGENQVEYAGSLSVFSCNLLNLVPGQEVSDGVDTYVVFPLFYHGVDGAPADRYVNYTGDYGWAIKKD